jgi:hypothetical protein
MKALKLALWLFIILWIASCATYQSSPPQSDYVKGYDAAWKFAKQDAMKSKCLRYPRYTYQEARKYTQLLQDQGRSESYISGFYFGYQNSYPDYFGLYCGETYDLEM